MDAMKFLEILNTLNKPTPKTYEFDVIKKLGQPDNRWWDGIKSEGNNYSKQKYHIHGTFQCVLYNDGRIPNECNPSQCLECYLNKSCNPHNNQISQTSENIINNKYNKMNKPEMYMWFIEAFELLDEERMNSCFKEVEDEWEKNRRIRGVRDIIEKYNITWEVVEEKIKNKIKNNEY